MRYEKFKDAQLTTISENLVNSYLNYYYFDYILVDKANIIRDPKIMALLSLSIEDIVLNG